MKPRDHRIAPSFERWEICFAIGSNAGALTIWKLHAGKWVQYEFLCYSRVLNWLKSASCWYIQSRANSSLRPGCSLNDCTGLHICFLHSAARFLPMSKPGITVLAFSPANISPPPPPILDLVELLSRACICQKSKGLFIALVGPPQSMEAADPGEAPLSAARLASASGSTSKGWSAMLRRLFRIRKSEVWGVGAAIVFIPGSFVTLTVPQQLQSRRRTQSHFLLECTHKGPIARTSYGCLGPWMAN